MGGMLAARRDTRLFTPSKGYLLLSSSHQDQ
jgi:hypothetical protein